MEKLGFFDEDFKKQFAQAKQTIWIHTVSVGEFTGAYPLIEALKAKLPDCHLVISTTTKAGQLIARERAGKIAQVIYFPFDLPWIVESYLSIVRPAMFIIFETELWPNFIDACWRRHIPVVLLNGRMSPRSVKGYKSIRFFFAPILKKLTFIATQTEQGAENYKAVAEYNLPIEVFGNLKYDWTPQLRNNEICELKHKLGIDSTDLVLIAGSTHPEEEKFILNVYEHLSNKIKLIIAPRHPERFEQVAKIIEKAGCKVIRYSRGQSFNQDKDIYLLDTIGQLANFYSLASVAFVGGTLANIGGHNLLEPYLYSVPVVCGPYLFKTRETAKILSNEKALLIGDSAQIVEDNIVRLLQDPQLREQMGNKGKKWLDENRGAVDKSVKAITDILQSQEINKERQLIN